MVEVIEATMGNTCHKATRLSAQRIAQPRSIYEVLRDIPIETVTDIDVAIESDPWSKRFLDYLRRRNSDDEALLFQFLVAAQVFQRKDEQLSELGKKLTNSNTKRISQLKRERDDSFVQIREHFFNADYPDRLIPLNNQTLFNSLLIDNNKSDNNNIDEKDLDLLRRAITDSGIVEQGLDPIFTRFIKQVTPSAIACLLSIL